MIKKKKIKRTNKPCPFCVKKTEPNYKDVESLEIGISNKRRIVSRWSTGICQKHQGRLASAIKRARYIALLPFTDRV